MTQFTSYGMGTSTSKAVNKKKFQAINQGFCECLPFRLQPYCMSNRHMHAYIEEKSSTICITDLTYNKTFRINDTLDLSEPLLNHAALPPGLTNCILISYHWDLAVVQVFHRQRVRFYICNLTSQTCVHVYTMCPCERRRPGLCEAYFTSDRSALILKANDTYYSLFSNSLKGSEASFIEAVSLDCKPRRSNHYTFPGTEFIPFAIVPDQENPKDVYTAFWSGASAGYGLEIRVGNIRECTGFHVKDFHVGGAHCEFQDNIYRFHNMFKYAHQMALGRTHRSGLINLQLPRNSDVLFCSTASARSEPRSLPKVVRTCTVTTVVREKHSMNTVETWIYDSHIGAQLDLPKLSPSGCYAFVGDQMIVSPTVGDLKPLSRICVDLITELVLSEDIELLPLPEKLKHVIKYG